MASSPRLEVDYCFGELDGHITYVLKEQDKEANLFKPEGVCEGSKREIVVPNIYRLPIPAAILCLKPHHDHCSVLVVGFTQR